MDYHKLALEKIAKQLETPAGFIRLSGPLEHDNIVNGDGLRAVVWTQGCPITVPAVKTPRLGTTKPASLSSSTKSKSV